MEPERRDIIHEGDTIVFRAITRWGAPKLLRKVVHVGETHIGVNAHGCRPFLVRRNEILKHIPQPVENWDEFVVWQAPVCTENIPPYMIWMNLRTGEQYVKRMPAMGDKPKTVLLEEGAAIQNRVFTEPPGNESLDKAAQHYGMDIIHQGGESEMECYICEKEIEPGESHQRLEGGIGDAHTECAKEHYEKSKRAKEESE